MTEKEELLTLQFFQTHGTERMSPTAAANGLSTLGLSCSPQEALTFLTKKKYFTDNGFALSDIGSQRLRGILAAQKPPAKPTLTSIITKRGLIFIGIVLTGLVVAYLTNLFGWN